MGPYSNSTLAVRCEQSLTVVVTVRCEWVLTVALAVGAVSSLDAGSTNSASVRTTNTLQYILLNIYNHINHSTAQH